jgi:sigma-B regulation protein RsbU (phosphoserine phosphatase)
MDVADSPIEAEARRSDAPAPESGSILVVDDNEDNRETLSRRLLRRGFDVSLAGDGPEALELIAGGKFDLVILDVMMPGMSGLEVLERLRQTHEPEDLPIIMATARDESENVVKALKLGANDYVTKPLDFPVVLARVETQLSLKRSFARIRELEQRLSARNADLEAAAEATRRDLQTAAMIQRSYLPRTVPDSTAMQFAWNFKPCEALAGDSLNICPLDDEHVAIYVLDVAGHGVAAALQAVAATRALAPAADPHSLLVERVDHTARLVPPMEVASLLNRQFAWDSATKQFMTIFYAIVNINTGHCRYTSAGHPAAIHLRSDGSASPVDGEGSGLPIGIGEAYKEFELTLEPGERLYLYSDGAMEAMRPDREMLGRPGLIKAIQDARNATLQESVAHILHTIEAWSVTAPKDDITVLAVQRLSNRPPT